MTEENKSTDTILEINVKKIYRFPKDLIKNWDVKTFLKEFFIVYPIFQAHAIRDSCHISNLDEITEIKVNGKKISLLKLKGLPNHRETRRERFLREARIFRSRNGIKDCRECHRDIYNSIHHFLCEMCYNSRNTPEELKKDG